jgi:hypothetical protein
MPTRQRKQPQRKKTNTAITVIRRNLQDNRPMARCDAIWALEDGRFKNAVPLIEPLLKDPDWRVKYTASAVLNLLSRKTAHHRLYREQNADFFDQRRKVLRQTFPKKEIPLILLGGQLAGKAVVRIISMRAFVAWRRAFEAKKFWERAGFDYVPVEPILQKPNGEMRFFQQKDGRFAVSTGVLRGPNLAIFLSSMHNKRKFGAMLEKQKQKITEVLEDLYIYHGHLHNKNFCVVMHKGKPRLYAIDFDAAWGA